MEEAADFLDKEGIVGAAARRKAALRAFRDAWRKKGERVIERKALAKKQKELRDKELRKDQRH